MQVIFLGPTAKGLGLCVQKRVDMWRHSYIGSTYDNYMTAAACSECLGSAAWSRLYPVGLGELPRHDVIMAYVPSKAAIHSLAPQHSSSIITQAVNSHPQYQATALATG
jgi:hypothetical protein